MLLAVFLFAVYVIPIDEELKTAFLKKESECLLKKLEFTHSEGQEEIQIKKNHTKVKGDQVKCVFAVSMDWVRK